MDEDESEVIDQTSRPSDETHNIGGKTQVKLLTNTFQFSP